MSVCKRFFLIIYFIAFICFCFHFVILNLFFWKASIILFVSFVLLGQKSQTNQSTYTLFCTQNLHWTVDYEGHHDVHISDVLVQVWIRQIKLCAPVSDIKT